MNHTSCTGLSVCLRSFLENELPKAEVVIWVPLGHKFGSEGTLLLVTLTLILFLFCPFGIGLRQA